MLNYKMNRQMKSDYPLPQLAPYVCHLGEQETALVYLGHGVLRTFSAKDLQNGLALIQHTAGDSWL